ncbi:MAG: Bax inhibitor-1/YccA family protein, partial [Propionibacteriaceae bacterium]|nr:Bax inhibitor-1/YccA family protein [Propionibacteriaceae bacterium]
MTNPVLAKSKNFLAQPGAGFQQGFEPPTEQPTYNAEYPYTQQFQTYTQPPNYAEGQPEGLGYPYSDAQPYPAGGFQEYVPEQTWEAPETPVIQKVMTLDDVLTKTALTLGLTIVVAIGSVTLAIAMGMDITLLMGAGLVCGLATIIFPFIAASRRKIGAGLAIAFSILEGVFIGSISLIFEMVYPGIVLQAVMATFVAAALVLVAFKFGKFRLSSKVRKIVMMSMMAYVGVALTNLILYFFGINLGL